MLFGAGGYGYIVCHYGVGRGARFHTSVDRLLCSRVGAGWGCKRVYVLLSYMLLPTIVRIDLIVRQVGEWGRENSILIMTIISFNTIINNDLTKH